MKDEPVCAICGKTISYPSDRIINIEPHFVFVKSDGTEVCIHQKCMADLVAWLVEKYKGGDENERNR